MAGIKVFGHAASTATRRVLLTLHEKNLDFELVHVELKDGEHKKEPFLSRNVSIYILTMSFETRPTTFDKSWSGSWMFFFVFDWCLQPFGKVPAFEDGDLKLFGMNVFMIFNLNLIWKLYA